MNLLFVDDSEMPIMPTQWRREDPSSPTRGANLLPGVFNSPTTMNGIRADGSGSPNGYKYDMGNRAEARMRRGNIYLTAAEKVAEAIICLRRLPETEAQELQKKLSEVGAAASACAGFLLKRPSDL